MLSQVGAIVHLARTEHVVCPVHGDWIDATDNVHAASQHASDKQASDKQHGEHCSVMYTLYQPTEIALIPGQGLSAPPIDIPVTTWLSSWNVSSIEQYSLAPKTSPPV
jgi:hypothetical protein